SMINLNVLNPKQLEKQLKVVESRISELENEIKDLERMRKACLILMGDPVDFDAPEAVPLAAPEAKPPKPKKAPPAPKAEASELHDKIRDTLQGAEGGL